MKVGDEEADIVPLAQDDTETKQRTSKGLNQKARQESLGKPLLAFFVV